MIIIRDCRRTFLTTIFSSGVDFDSGQDVLLISHSLGRCRATYDRLHEYAKLGTRGVRAWPRLVGDADAVGNEVGRILGADETRGGTDVSICHSLILSHVPLRPLKRNKSF